MKLADKIVLAAICAWVGASYWLFWTEGGDAQHLIVERPNQPAYPVDLNADQDFKIDGALGESHIQIEDKKARFIASPCRGKHCVHSGWLASAGDVAACLPNGVTIYLQDDQSRYDSINF